MGGKGSKELHHTRAGSGNELIWNCCRCGYGNPRVSTRCMNQHVTRMGEVSLNVGRSEIGEKGLEKNNNSESVSVPCMHERCAKCIANWK